MTLNPSDYLEKKPVAYNSKASGKQILISAKEVEKVLLETNSYLYSLHDLFAELKFDLYRILEQRNLSGFIGEVFAKVFVKQIDGYTSNPHADGRPDILDVSTPDALRYFSEKCLLRLENGTETPNKSLLAPFKYGGIEIKSTIGNPVSNYKVKLKEKRGVHSFSVGTPRVDYLQSITYWGHHANCENLLGLYYDYCEELNGVPQIMAVMHALLDPKHDWNAVSTGKAGSKKTSNTSLTQQGQKKILAGPVVVSKNQTYIEKLRQIGLDV